MYVAMLPTTRVTNAGVSLTIISTHSGIFYFLLTARSGAAIAVVPNRLGMPGM